MTQEIHFCGSAYQYDHGIQLADLVIPAHIAANAGTTAFGYEHAAGEIVGTIDYLFKKLPYHLNLYLFPEPSHPGLRLKVFQGDAIVIAATTTTEDDDQEEVLAVQLIETEDDTEEAEAERVSQTTPTPESSPIAKKALKKSKLAKKK